MHWRRFRGRGLLAQHGSKSGEPAISDIAWPPPERLEGASLRNSFLDPRLQRDFERDGFVVVDLLDGDAVRQLDATLRPLLPDGDGFTNSVQVLDQGYRAAVHDAISPVLGPPAKALLDDHCVNITAIALKRPGFGSTKPVHQDWSLCDEGRFRMVNVWVPLVDTDVHNGTLSVLPGSHSLIRRLRPAPRFPNGYVDVLDELDLDDLVPVPARAGQAIIIDVALAHASAPNLSGTERVAAVINLLPSEAMVTYSYCHDDDRIEQFEVDGFEFFHRFDWRIPPDLRSLGIVEAGQPSVDAAQLRSVGR